MSHYGVTADQAMLAQCPLCRRRPFKKCRYTGGTVRGKSMPLMHASRYLHAKHLGLHQFLGRPA